jgi:hypothetical protein
MRYELPSGPLPGSMQLRGCHRAGAVEEVFRGISKDASVAEKEAELLNDDVRAVGKLECVPVLKPTLNGAEDLSTVKYQDAPLESASVEFFPVNVDGLVDE